MDKKQVAIDFLRLVAAQKVEEAFALHVASGFLHHNPYNRSDAESLKKGMIDAAPQQGSMELQVHHAVHEGDLVAVHSLIQIRPGNTNIAVVHIFRFHEDKIVELWDIGQAVPENMANERGMF
jgi:predicted SnoaL-like aldol condensation-catalyzing enzyme